MMGVAGENVVADHVDTLDLFHTMEAYFTWYPRGSEGGRPPSDPPPRAQQHTGAREGSAS